MNQPSKAACAYFGVASEGIALPLRPLRAGVWSTNDISWAELLVDRYEHVTLPLIQAGQHVDHESNETTTLIPKIIHFIWLGPKAIPQHLSIADDAKTHETSNEHHEWNACMRSWLEHHPLSSGWEINLWTESDAQSTFLASDASFSMKNSAAYEYAILKKNYGLASDILRLELLWHVGGLYVDIDYLCTASVNDLHSTLTFYCGASNVGCVEVNNGLVGCTKRHALVKRMVDDIHEWFDNTPSMRESSARAATVMPSSFLTSFLDEQSAESLSKVTELTHEDVIKHTGPGLITRTLINALPNTADGDDGEREVAVLPASYIHSLPNCKRHDIRDHTDKQDFIETYGDSTTRAIHLWGCSWQK